MVVTAGAGQIERQKCLRSSHRLLAGPADDGFLIFFGGRGGGDMPEGGGQSGEIGSSGWCFWRCVAGECEAGQRSWVRGGAQGFDDPVSVAPGLWRLQRGDGGGLRPSVGITSGSQPDFGQSLGGGGVRDEAIDDLVERSR